MKLTLILFSFMVSTSLVYGDPASKLLGHHFVPDCKEGLTAFEETAFSMVMQNCAECHNGTRRIPDFVQSTAEETYYRVLNYQNFSDLKNSIFLIRAGNSHCGKENCNAEAGTKMKELVTSWWDQGEKKCNRIGTYFTNEMPIPEELPGPGSEEFVTMEWDLGTIVGGLGGTKLSVEVQQYVEASGEVPGAYRFRNIRFIDGRGAISVAGINLLVNRKHDALANAFDTIQATVSKPKIPSGSSEVYYPLLSAREMIVLQDLEVSDKLSVAFRELKIAKPFSCNAGVSFGSKVLSTVRTEECASCHGDEGTTGTAPANEKFNMAITDEEMCIAMKERIDFDFPIHSVGLAVPLRGLFGHPVLTKEKWATFVDGFLSWVEMER